MRFFFHALSLAAAAMLAAPASAQTVLPPFKDALFAYPGVLSSADGGGYRVVDYDEARDIDRRDAIPERRVQGAYVSLGVKRQQDDLVADTAAGRIAHIAVGARENASLILAYLHGQGGSRKQGVDDYTFGGNFNRIKNLVAAAGGLYLSPDFSSFDETGASQVAALLSLYAAKSPGAPIFIACGSMGGVLCWNLAKGPEMAKRLGGLLLLGSLWDDSFLASAAFKARVPLFIGQGSRDPVFPIAHVEDFYHAILRKAPDYPVKMVRFETGNHGTPIRMTDWRETINWMLATKR
jgi:hypothetical protein